MFDQNQDISIDSLPYIDEYTPDIEKYVHELIQAEMRTFVPQDYLKHVADEPVIFV